MSYVIATTDRQVEYYTCDVNGLAFGGSHIFVDDESKALQFARVIDADNFVTRFLRGVDVMVRRAE